MACYNFTQRWAAVIPAKGHSTRLPGKNMLLLANKSLFLHSADAAIKAGLAKCDIFVSTESNEIVELSKTYGLSVINETPAPGGDTLKCVIEASEILGENYDAFLVLQPTSPFRTNGIVEKCMSVIESGGYDSVCTCLTKKPHWFKDSVPQYNTAERPNAELFTPTDLMQFFNGSVCALNRETFLTTKSLYGGRFLAVVDDLAVNHIDIDTADDFLLAQRVASMYHNDIVSN